LAQLLQNPVVMIIAIPVWSGRVSPVFDVAKKVLIAEIDARSGELVAEGTHVLNPIRPASTLIELGVDLLVCSAISSAVEAMLWAHGVDVVSDICGSPDEIMAALAAGDTELTRFHAPGSRRRPRCSPLGSASQGQGGPGTPG
jgi:predicted Fe-Mo cluster-binding NifX family protein